jgi:hypothetical protein
VFSNSSIVLVFDAIILSTDTMKKVAMPSNNSQMMSFYSGDDAAGFKV